MSGIPNSLDTQGYSADEIPASTPPEVSNYMKTDKSRIAVASVSFPTKEEEVPEDLDEGRLEEESPKEIVDTINEEKEIEIDDEPVTDPIKPLDLEEEGELETESAVPEELEVSTEEEPSIAPKSEENPWLKAVESERDFIKIKSGLLIDLASDPMNIGLTREEQIEVAKEMENIFAEIDRSFLEKFYQAREVVSKFLALESGDIETIAQEELVSPYLLRMNIYEFTFKDHATKYRDIGMGWAMCLAVSAYESSKILDDKNAAESLFSNLSKEEYLRPLLSPQGLTSEQKQSLMNSANENIGDAETLDKVLEVFFDRARRMHLIRESN